MWMRVTEFYDSYCLTSFEVKKKYIYKEFQGIGTCRWVLVKLDSYSNAGDLDETTNNKTCLRHNILAQIYNSSLRKILTFCVNLSM